MLDNGYFGETSTEVCGIYTTYGSNGGAASAPTITIDGETIDLTDEYSEAIRDNVVLYDYGIVDGMDITVSGVAGSNVFINGTDVTSYTTIEGTSAVQIIVQSGTAEPFIVVIK